jgi:hypothetical protein
MKFVTSTFVLSAFTALNLPFVSSTPQSLDISCEACPLPSPNCKFEPPCRPVQGVAPKPGDRDPRPYCKLPDGVAPPPSMAPASRSGCGSCPEIVCSSTGTSTTIASKTTLEADESRTTGSGTVELESVKEDSIVGAASNDTKTTTESSKQELHDDSVDSVESGSMILSFSVPFCQYSSFSFAKTLI